MHDANGIYGTFYITNNNFFYITFNHTFMNIHIHFSFNHVFILTVYTIIPTSILFCNVFVPKFKRNSIITSLGEGGGLGGGEVIFILNI